MANVASLLVDMQVNSAALRTGLDQANGHLKRFGDSMDGLKRKVMGALSAAVFIDFAKSSVQAFAASEKATAQLSNALKRMGYESAALTTQLKAQASAFQSNLGVSDDMVIGMQSLLVSFGVAPKDIEKTTAALLDYSAFMGEDATSATQKLVTAINSGSTKALKSMGITIHDTGDKAKNLAAAVDAMGVKFGGSAAANADTMAGRVAKMSEAFGDMQKGFGAFLANLENKLGLMQKIIAALGEWNYMLGGEGDADAASQKRANETLGAQKDVEYWKQTLANAKAKLSEAQSDKDKGGLAGFFATPKGWESQVSNAEQKLREAYGRLQVTREAQEEATFFALGAGPDVSATGASDAAKKMLSGKTEKQDKADESAAEKKSKQWVTDFEAKGDKARAAAESWSRAQEESAAEYMRRQIGVTEAEMENAKERAEEEKKASAKIAEAAKKAADALATLKDNAINAALGMAQSLLSKTGRTGNLINSAISGGQQGYAMGQFAEAAGVPGASYGGAAAGAAVGVVSDLVSSSKGFALVVDTADRIIQKTADTMGALFEGMGPLLTAFYDFETAGADVLVPYLTLLANQANKLAPVLELLALLWDGMTAVGVAFATQLQIGAGTWEKIARGLFDMMKSGGGAFLNVVIDVSRFWNTMMSSIADLLRSVADFDVAGAKPFGFLKATADELRRFDIPTKEVAETLAELNDATYDGVTAQLSAAAAADKITAAFLNVPSGYRIAGARFGADGGGAGALPGAGVTGTAFAPNLPPMEVTVNVHGANDPEQFANKFGQLLRDHTFNARGRYGRRRI